MIDVPLFEGKTRIITGILMLEKLGITVAKHDSYYYEIHL